MTSDLQCHIGPTGENLLDSGFNTFDPLPGRVKILTQLHLSLSLFFLFLPRLLFHLIFHFYFYKYNIHYRG